ncbi:rRNA-processing protein FCF2 [Hortaea werneckii]|nr:rRNA-processing protein FCF2 [Hortaea werneckii]
MAGTDMAPAGSSVAGDGDLSDEQIDQLLARATDRMQQAGAVVKDDEKSPYTFPKLNAGELEKPYIASKGAVASVDSSRLLDDKDRKQANSIRKVEDPLTAKKAAVEKQKATAGADWYNLPRTDLTPELKRDLQLLKMRGVLDPHRHYKKEGGKMQAPEYSQVGTIVEGPTEFYSGRIENKKRKRTFVEEVLSGEQETGRFKRKYGELQDKKGSGKKAFYKALKAQRKGGVKKGG